MDDEDTTYRVIILGPHDEFENRERGDTAATPELAKLAARRLESMREGRILALEQSYWFKKFEKWVLNRSVIVEAESEPGEWTIGVSAEPRKAKPKPAWG